MFIKAPQSFLSPSRCMRIMWLMFRFTKESWGKAAAFEMPASEMTCPRSVQVLSTARNLDLLLHTTISLSQRQNIQQQYWLCDNGSQSSSPAKCSDHSSLRRACLEHAHSHFHFSHFKNAASSGPYTSHLPFSLTATSHGTASCPLPTPQGSVPLRTLTSGSVISVLGSAT